MEQRRMVVELLIEAKPEFEDGDGYLPGSVNEVCNTLNPHVYYATKEDFDLPWRVLEMRQVRHV